MYDLARLGFSSLGLAKACQTFDEGLTDNFEPVLYMQFKAFELATRDKKPPSCISMQYVTRLVRFLYV